VSLNSPIKGVPGRGLSDRANASVKACPGLTRVGKKIRDKWRERGRRETFGICLCFSKNRKREPATEPTCHHHRVTCPFVNALRRTYPLLPQTPTSTPATYQTELVCPTAPSEFSPSRIQNAFPSTPPDCGNHGLTLWISCSPSSDNSSLRQRVTGSEFQPHPALAMALVPLLIRMSPSFS